MAQVPRKTGVLGLVTGLWADWFTLLLGWSGRPPVFTGYQPYSRFFKGNLIRP